MARDANRPFEILVREHESALLAFVVGLGVDRAAGDDIVQEAFLAAWRGLDEYDDALPFARWLRGIARNKVLAFRRQSAIAGKHVRFLDADQMSAVAGEFDRLLPGRGDAMTESLDALRRCLEALPPPHREVIRLAYEERRSSGRIGDLLGETVEAVRKRIQRARTRLRDCILAKLAARADGG